MVTRTDSHLFSPEAADVHAVVLAAGAGTRMGGGKLRRAWQGRPLLSWALEAAFAAPVEAVWLITGADEAVANCAPANARLTVVVADAWEEGLSASLRCGIGRLPGSATAALVFLGDMPRIPHGVASALIDAWRSGAKASAPTWNGRRGHPVLLDRSLFSKVAGLSGDKGAGALLASLGDGLALVDAPDDGVLFDVDTPDLLEL